MERAIDETDRRRAVQARYNEEHEITPQSIRKSVQEIRFTTAVADARVVEGKEEGTGAAVAEPTAGYEAPDPEVLVQQLEQEMREAAQNLDFERAARLRDELFDVKAQLETGAAPRRRRRGADSRAGGRSGRGS